MLYNVKGKQLSQKIEDIDCKEFIYIMLIGLKLPNIGRSGAGNLTGL